MVMYLGIVFCSYVCLPAQVTSTVCGNLVSLGKNLYPRKVPRMHIRFTADSMQRSCYTQIPLYMHLGYPSVCSGHHIQITPLYIVTCRRGVVSNKPPRAPGSDKTQRQGSFGLSTGGLNLTNFKKRRTDRTLDLFY